MTHTDCKLGAVQQQNDGHGFVVRNARNAPIASLTYATQAKAKRCIAIIAKAIEGPEITLAAAR